MNLAVKITGMAAAAAALCGVGAATATAATATAATATTNPTATAAAVAGFHFRPGTPGHTAAQEDSAMDRLQQLMMSRAFAYTSLAPELAKDGEIAQRLADLDR